MKSSTAAQRIGTIAHALILEPETFWSEYAAPFEPPEGAVDTVPELKARLNDIMSRHTGQSVEQIEIDLERDRFMSAEAAVEYGMIDKVLARRNEIPKAKSS